jgi:hypothetical protein
MLRSGGIDQTGVHSERGGGGITHEFNAGLRPVLSQPGQRGQGD